MSQILPNSSSIHAKIKEMFSPQTRGKRRVILVAYVGKDAPSLLPDAKNVEIYCWPQAGATHPDAIRALIQQEAKLFFVTGLHMKLYWVEGMGTLLTSANLSRNALGVGGLHEAGVFLEDTTGLDINHLIQGLNAEPVTEEAMDELQRDHDHFSERLRLPSSSPKTPSLLEWFDQPMRRKWKLGWFDGEGISVSQSALAQTMRDYHVAQPHWWQSCKASDYERGDWALEFPLSKNQKSPLSFHWRHIHFVSPTEKKDPAYSKYYPFQAVQAIPLNKGTTPPFRLDTPTKAVLRAAIERYGSTAIKKLKVPSPSAKFLTILREEATSQLAAKK